MNASDIAASVRDAVLEPRTAGVPLAAELAAADPSLDQTVAWCLGLADAETAVGREDAGVDDPTASPSDRTNAPPTHDRRRGADRRNPTRLRGP